MDNENDKAGTRKQEQFYVPLPPVIQVAPFPDQPQRKNPFDIASFVLGTIAITSHWIVLFEWGLILFVVPLILSLLAISLGSTASYRLLSRKSKKEKPLNKLGLTGFSLGLLSLMFSTTWLILAQTYLWGWEI